MNFQHIVKTALAAVFLLMVASLPCAAKSSSLATPDFAYPKTVAKDASATLAKALKSQDSSGALRALVNLIVAENLVDKENVTGLLEKTDSVSRLLPAPYSGFCLLLQADILSSIYSDSPYLYDNRQLDAETAGSNPLSWNRQIFASNISRLADSALSQRESAELVPLSDIHSLITEIADEEEYSVYDFFVYKSIQLKSRFANEEAVIPFFAPRESIKTQNIDLLDSLLKLHATPSAARNNALFNKALLLPLQQGAGLIWDEIVSGNPTPLTIPQFLFFSQNYMPQAPWNEPEGQSMPVSFEDYCKVLLHLKEKLSSAPGHEDLDNLYKRLIAPAVSLIYPSRIQSGKEFPVRVENSNFNKLYVLLLDARGLSTDNPTVQSAKNCKIIGYKELSYSQAMPFGETDTILLSVAKPGKYLIAASRSSSPSGIITISAKENLRYVLASDIDVITVSPHYAKTSKAEGCFVVQSSDCRPIEGASVSFKPYSYGRDRQPASTVLTDSDGFAPTSMRNGDIKATFGGSSASTSIYCGSSSAEPHREVRMFASRAVYHPGDSVNFFGLVYLNDINTAVLSSQTNVKLFLRDANYQKIDSLNVVSDASGRFFAIFPLPADGLRGLWRVEALVAPDEKDDGNAVRSNLTFQVADYKVPSFYVSLTKESAPSDSVAFQGNAFTFSGIPIAGSQVNYTVTYRPDYRHRWTGGTPETFSAQTLTDSDGIFRISLPTANLSPEVYSGVFSVSATVTDQAGESVESPVLPFRLKDTFSLSAMVPEFEAIDKGELSWDIRVTDNAGLPAVQPVLFTVKDGKNEVVARGEFDSPRLAIDVKNLRSGLYHFDFTLRNDSTCHSEYSTILYRSDETQIPVDTTLWLPLKNITVPSGDVSVCIPYGSSRKGQHVLCTISNSNGTFDYRWLVCDGTVSRLELPSPKDNERLYVTFFTYRNHQPFSSCVTVVPQPQTLKLNIVSESFRPVISSGQREHWKFRLDFDGKPVEGYGYALLYDKAMDEIAPLFWNTRLFSPYYPDMVSLSGPGSYPLSRTFRSSNVPGLRGNSLADFGFQTYGYPLYSNSGYRIYARKMMSSRATAGGMVEEVAENSYSRAAKADFADDAEAAVEAGATEEESPSVQGASTSDIPLRQTEMPVAFFRPDLSFDNDGNLELDFTVPNFNTTWRLLLGAYTDSLQSAGISLESVASKPVMVKMLSPRFLRTGDEIALAATLYNNSSDSLQITGVYEIFNPLSGKVLKRYVANPEWVGPSGSDVFSIGYTCPSDLSILGLRVYALSGNSSDGEETLIPVLPSSQPVVSSRPFYLQAGEREAELRFPSSPEGAVVTFTYCDNPVWEVVTSLPSLVSAKDGSVFSQLAAFYADCVGSGLLNRYPDIRKGLRLIVDGEAGDSLQVSNLQKNEDLKLVTLHNTPWVNDAAAENLRLASLSSLLDSIAAVSAIEGLWKAVMAYHNADGGWSWCKGMKSSSWISRQVLLRLGMLSDSGYLPSLPSYQATVKSGLRYCDNEVVNDFSKLGRKSQDGYLRGLGSYLYIRSFFPDFEPASSFRDIQRRALGVIEKGWKSADVYEKAVIARVLFRYGRKAAAREVLESLRQFASFGNQGAFFANLSSANGGASKLAVTAMALEAFNEVLPGDPIVDDLRQWVLIQRQGQDWQEGILSLDAINSLLTTGSEWTGGYSLPDILIAGKPIPRSELEKLTGSCKVTLSPEESLGGIIQIRRSSPTPAWGGIVSQYVAPISDIKAEKIPDVGIEKSLLVYGGDGGAVSMSSPSSLKVGDRVRVTLSVKCNRDLDYVVISDQRAACLNPSDQLSGFTSVDGLPCYMEVRDSSTNLFFPFLSKGTHLFSYDCFVSAAGEFACGVASLQSLYAPVITAHSAGNLLQVEE